MFEVRDPKPQQEFVVFDALVVVAGIYVVVNVTFVVMAGSLDVESAALVAVTGTPEVVFEPSVVVDSA